MLDFSSSELSGDGALVPGKVAFFGPVRVLRHSSASRNSSMEIELRSSWPSIGLRKSCIESDSLFDFLPVLRLFPASLCGCRESNPFASQVHVMENLAWSAGGLIFQRDEISLFGFFDLAMDFSL